MPSTRYVFAGGGTGGHLFPGLAVAEALRRAEADAQLTFFTTTRQLDREVLDRTDYEQVAQSVRPATLKPWKWWAFWQAWRASVAAARQHMQRQPPRAVLGLGGYAAGPPVVAARQLGIRAAVLNPDAIPGRANRYLARYANLVAMQWEVSRRHFPASANCQVLGCPIRAEFSRAECATAREKLGLAADRPVLLVTGASQGARSVNETLQLVWPEFVTRHPEWQLLHLTGPTDEAATRAAYARAGAAALVLAFMHEMWHGLAAADLVLSRAGASTLAEITALGKPAILLPYPFHRDRHQHANAQVLVDAGAALLVEDERSGALNRTRVAEALEQLSDPGLRARMTVAAAGLGRPRAAEDVALWLRGQ